MSANEYLPDETTNGNGGNGHGNGRIFNLKPATDPDTLLVLDARRDALAEPKTVLTLGAKAFFCEVLDRCLNPRYFDRKGVATISDKVLADGFSVSRRSIYSWKRMVEAAGYFWTSHKWKSNMWPLTIYHLTCLHKKPLQGRTDADGTYGGGKLRPPPIGGLGARQPGQPILPLVGSRSSPPKPENADLQGIAAETSKKDRLPAEAGIGSQPKQGSAQSRSRDRLRAEAGIGSEPKQTSDDSRSTLRATAEADREHIETLGEVGAVEVPIFKRLSNRAKDAGTKRSKRLRADTEEFLNLVREVCGADEATNNSGLWVTNLHGDPGLAYEVIHETASAKKEGRIKKTPARHAMDDWKRRWSEKHPDESVVAAAERRRAV